MAVDALIRKPHYYCCCCGDSTGTCPPGLCADEAVAVVVVGGYYCIAVRECSDPRVSDAGARTGDVAGDPSRHLLFRKVGKRNGKSSRD